MSDQGETVVVGYDGSPPARAAVEYGARRAEPDGKLYVVHAYGPPADWLGYPYYERVLEDHRDRGSALLDKLADEVDFDFERELIGGRPSEAILAVADARDADEIVVGSRGLGPIRASVGSVSHEVLHHARVPVVVMPHEES